MQATPSLWRGLCTEAMSEISGPAGLVGGEAFERGVAARLIPGPTPWSMSTGPRNDDLVDQCDPAAVRSSFDRAPLTQHQVYVLDRALRPLPVGEIGELWIAGPGGKGYLATPLGSRAARFVANPFFRPFGVSACTARATALGGRRRRDRVLGRNDTQVKLRGMRIELTDVERLLVRHPDVRQAQVCLQRVRDYGPARLVAYLVLQGPDVAKPRDFAAFLEREVPNTCALPSPSSSTPFPHPERQDRRKRPARAEAGSDSLRRAPTSGLQTTLVPALRDASESTG